MVLGFLALLISFAISSIAIYFSVTGFGALFAAAAIPAMLMFGSIEIGKLVAVAFLHWHWKEMGRKLKYLLTSMVLVAMVITSVGIYGFLAKGHLDQEIPANTALLKIERIDQRIFKEEENINRLETRLQQLDAAIKVYFDREYVTKGLKVRKQQQEERELIDTGVKESYNSIDILEEEKLGFKEQIGSVQAKLGPIKYITQILNVENKDMAVQIIIIMAMFTFDPFAIALLLAAIWKFKSASITKQARKKILLRHTSEENVLHNQRRRRAVHASRNTEENQEAKAESKIKTPNVKNSDKTAAMARETTSDSSSKPLEDQQKEIKKIIDELKENPESVTELIKTKSPEIIEEIQEHIEMAHNHIKLNRNGWLD